MQTAGRLAVLAFFLAGCFDASPPDPDNQPAGSSSATSSTGPPWCCIPDENVTFRVDIESPGPFAIAVPFPHLDWCLGAERWLTGTRTFDNLGNAEWREVDRGHVLWMDGDGGSPAFHQFVLTVTHTPRCQTLRYDPWSIEPDLDNGSVEVFGAAQRGRIGTDGDNGTQMEDAPTAPARIQVMVQHATSTCTSDLRFVGTVGNDKWSTLGVSSQRTCP